MDSSDNGLPSILSLLTVFDENADGRPARRVRRFSLTETVNCDSTNSSKVTIGSAPVARGRGRRRAEIAGAISPVVTRKSAAPLVNNKEWFQGLRHLVTTGGGVL